MVENEDIKVHIPIEGFSSRIIDYSVLTSKAKELEKIFNQYDCNKQLSHLFKPFRVKYEKEMKLMIKSNLRITIPIFGYMSTGKSTIMNAFLGQELLQVGPNITTKFACILRHTTETKPVLYKAKYEAFKYEGKEYFIFEENGAPLATGHEDVNAEVERINQYCLKLQNNIIYNENEGISNKMCLEDPKEFFYILKVKIPILESLSSEKQKVIEFIDFPGLNEDSDFFIKTLLPIIIPNSLGYIFIFDHTTYKSTDCKEILNIILRYIKIYQHSSYLDKSICLLNKIDLIEQPDERIKILENSTKYINSILNSSKLIPISGKKALNAFNLLDFKLYLRSKLYDKFLKDDQALRNYQYNFKNFLIEDEMLFDLEESNVLINCSSIEDFLQCNQENRNKFIFENKNTIMKHYQVYKSYSNENYDVDKTLDITDFSNLFYLHSLMSNNLLSQIKSTNEYSDSNVEVLNNAMLNLITDRYNEKINKISANFISSIKDLKNNLDFIKKVISSEKEIAKKISKEVEESINLIMTELINSTFIESCYLSYSKSFMALFEKYIEPIYKKNQRMICRSYILNDEEVNDLLDKFRSEAEENHITFKKNKENFFEYFEKTIEHFKEKSNDIIKDRVEYNSNASIDLCADPLSEIFNTQIYLFRRYKSEIQNILSNCLEIEKDVLKIINKYSNVRNKKRYIYSFKNLFEESIEVINKCLVNIKNDWMRVKSEKVDAILSSLSISNSFNMLTVDELSEIISKLDIEI